jgi:hypothetical protein
MADFAINDAETSCKHPGQMQGKKCKICGKLVPANPSAGADEWKGTGTTSKKNA